MFGELLYLGLHYEKGYVPTGFWSRKYRKSLVLHLECLQMLCHQLSVRKVDENDNIILKMFYSRIAGDKRLKARYYYNEEAVEMLVSHDFTIIDDYNDGKNDKRITQLIAKMLEDLLLELAAKKIDRDKIAKQLHNLHNLPRAYLWVACDSPYGMTLYRGLGISSDLALKYTLGDTKFRQC